MSDIIEKRYFSINDVCDKTKHTKSKVRYWIDFFEIKAHKSMGRAKLFTKEDFDKLLLINEESERGLKLVFIKRKLEKRKKAEQEKAGSVIDGNVAA